MSTVTTSSRAAAQRKAAAELLAAFARAEREQRQLQRLKAQHPQFGALYFRPDDEEQSC